MELIKRFLKYVEIRTKLASVLPFALALLYCIYHYGQLNWLNTAIFFISMIFFDMATTALNNFMDTHKNQAPLPFTLPVARRVLLALLAVATLAGLLLVWQAGLVVLVCGALCFLIGITYTFGPVQISHLPLGEAFSGIFMGFFIPFLAVYVNVPPVSLADYALKGWMLTLSFNLEGLLRLIVFTVPAICGIANIMLANNICDLEYDRSIGRLTLVHHLGINRSLILFAALYAIAFAAVPVMVLTGILPLYGLAVLLAFIPVQANIRKFFRKQDKRETFAFSVQNFTLIMILQIAMTGLAIVLK